ncbi:MAG: ACT domain-containing protein, partial [Actinomycetota bacterium]
TEDPTAVVALVEAALAGTLDIGERVAERRRAYARRGGSVATATVTIVPGAPGFDTVVEVQAADDVGLLARLTGALAALGLDVRLAKVATLGDRVVDVFYVRSGAQTADEGEQARIRAGLLAVVGAE